MVNNNNAIRNNNQMNRNERIAQRNRERLASGRQINRAADNAAGLAISEGLINQLIGLEQAINNSLDGVNMLRTADGALSGQGDVLARARELTVQAANDTLTSDQRNMIYQEIDQLLSEVDRMSTDTQFNRQGLIDGSRESVGLQIGANAGQRMNAYLSAVNTDTMGLSNFRQMFSDAAATGVPVGGRALSAMLDTLDGAVGTVATARAGIGAIENRLNHSVNSTRETAINTASANSRIRDTDMARASMDNNRDQLMSQVGMAMQLHSQVHMRAGLRLLG